MAATQSSFPSLTNTGGPAKLSKEALIWITVLSVVVVATAIIVGILLCRCTCSRKKGAEKKRQREDGHSRHSSLEVTDGRNDHWAWNKKYAPSGPMTKDGTAADGFELTPLSKAAVGPAGSPFEAFPAQPVVVDEEIDPLKPMYSRSRGSRYYSGVQNAWKRVSQSIGRAY
jgi:hypothetical protein